MKLAIGTVQFGINYGINNKNGIPSDIDVAEIFDLSIKNNIKYLDTSISYGNSEERISKLANNKFNIITKSNNVKNSEELSSSILTSLSSLKTESVYGFLFHNSDNLIDNHDLWSTLVKFKNEKKVNKIGYSIYDTNQIDYLLDKGFIPDIVQLPYSLLDRKFEKYFMKLKKLGTEIHVRSVFLQGLYFMNNKKLPEKLLPLRKYLDNIDCICRKFNVSIGELALNFVNENKFIDKIIMGVDSSTQLNQNIQMIKNWDNNNNINKLINKIIVKEQDLLSPINW
jgi:aryl-alcohol dehydrogenase-like predicted oxidoreductase